MKVKFRKLTPNAVIPNITKSNGHGIKLTAVSRILDNDGNIVYGTGLCVEIPKGYVGLLVPLADNYKRTMALVNSVCVIVSGDNSEVFMKFKPLSIFTNLNGYVSTRSSPYYNQGDYIGTLIIVPALDFEIEEV